MKRSSISAIFVILTGLFFTARAEVLDRIIAVVGDEIILKSEIDQIVEHQKYSSRFGFDEDSFRRSVLDEMISTKTLYYAALNDSNISVSDEEVQRILDGRISSVIAQVGGEEKLEEMYNTTVSDLKKQYLPEIRKGLFIEKIRNRFKSKVRISRDEVEQFYSIYKDSIPAVRSSVNLSQLVIGFSDKALNESSSSELLKNIKKDIIEGDITFEAAAEKYSHDEASKAAGGSVGTTNRGDLVAEYEREAYRLEPGDISDPVKTPFGYHLIRVNEKSGEKISTSHILIMPEKSVSSDSTALGFAENIRDSIINKTMTFEEAVRKYSRDEKTKYSGGEIGKMNISDMDMKYHDLFASSPEGFISGPVKEKDGYYIYKINDREEEHEVSLSRDYGIVRDMARERKASAELKKWIDELKKNVYIDIRL